MRKIASALLGGSIVGLSLTVPGVASAATSPTCGTTNVSSQSQYDQLFSTSAANDTRATGHHDLTADGLRIWTEGNTSTDKVTGYHDVAPVALAAQHAQSDYVLDTDNTSGDGLPGYQLVMDFNNDTVPDGILVGESVYGDDWWLTNGSSADDKNGAPHNDGGSGSPWHGTLDEWNSSFPSAQIDSFGYSLGSGVKGDLLLKNLSFGCATYAFAQNLPPKALFWIWDKHDHNYRTFKFNAENSSDPEGAALTYAWTFGDGTSGTGVAPSHTFPARNRIYKVTLTVSDGQNTATISHNVTVSR